MSDNNSPVGSPTPAEQDAPEVEELQQTDDNIAVPADDHSDQESDVLSEIDENQFEDYDPETANIEDRPVVVDEDIAKTLKASRRKRPEGETIKKPKEGRREKKRQREEEEVPGEDGDFDEEGSTQRRRRAGESRARSQKKSPEPEDEENLTPEERRRRALERALDAAFKKPVKRRKRRDEEVRPLPSRKVPSLGPDKTHKKHYSALLT